jgi:hypothetical protein
LVAVSTWGTIKSLGVQERMSQSATRIGRDSRSGVPRHQAVDLCGGQVDAAEHFARGIGRIVDLSAEGELDSAGGERVTDLPSVRHRAGKSVAFRYDEGVTLADGGEGLVEAGMLSVSSGQPVVEIDPLVGRRSSASRWRWAVRSCSSVEQRA